jgi:hypothetical protein
VGRVSVATMILAACLALAASSQAGVRSVRTQVYRASDHRRIGFVQRYAPGSWSVNRDDDCDGDLPDLGADKKGGYYLDIGLSGHSEAWPKPAGQRAVYVVHGDNPGETVRRESSKRWELLRGGRVVASAEGPDGVAAGLAYFMGCFS